MNQPKAVSGLHMQQLANEVMVYNETDGQAHALNAVAAAVLEHCDGNRSREALVEAVAATVDTPVDLEVIDLALNDLDDSGLINGGAVAARVSRRDLIRKLGVGAAAAAALPIVESVITPAAANTLGSGPVPTPFPTPYLTKPPFTYEPTFVPTYAPQTPAPTFVPTGPPQTTLVPTNAPQTPAPTGPRGTMPPLTLPPLDLN